MKTLRKQIEENFDKSFLGHPSRKDEDDIKQIKLAIIKLAQAVDNINEYGNFGGQQ